MTAGERLRALAGTTGTAAALLLLIGSGPTAGAALVDYSGLPTGTATEHLLAEAAVASPPQARRHAGGFTPLSDYPRAHVLILNAAARALEMERAHALAHLALPGRARDAETETGRAAATLALFAPAQAAEAEAERADCRAALDWARVNAQDEEFLLLI